MARLKILVIQLGTAVIGLIVYNIYCLLFSINDIISGLESGKNDFKPERHIWHNSNRKRSLKWVIDMAKRRSTIGKKGKHGREGIGIVIDKAARRRKKRLMIIVTVIVILALILASVYYFFIYLPKPEKEKEVLTTDTQHNEGYPNDQILFGFTLYNPDKEPDVFSPLVSGLPSDWEMSLPNTVTVESKRSKDEDFSITPSPKTALNRTYSFMLNVTSGNTQHTYTLEYQLTVLQALYGVELLCYNNSHHADPGRSTYYAITVKNIGNAEDTITLSYNESHLPNNWSISFESVTLDIPGLSSEVVICNITTFSNSSKGRYDIDIIATSSSGKIAKIWLNTSLIKDFGDETVKSGDKIQVNYIGTLTDGVIFDTSYFEVANNSDYPKSETFSMRHSYEPLKVQVSDSDPDENDHYTTVIVGFREGVIGMKVDETNVVRIPPEKGYTNEIHHLYGLTLIFEITIVSIDD